MEKVDTMSEHMGKVSQRRRLQEETTVIKISLTEMKNPFNGLIGRELKNLSAWNYLNRNPKNTEKNVDVKTWEKIMRSDDVIAHGGACM